MNPDANKVSLFCSVARRSEHSMPIFLLPKGLPLCNLGPSSPIMLQQNFWGRDGTEPGPETKNWSHREQFISAGRVCGRCQSTVRLQIPTSSNMIGRNQYEASKKVKHPVHPDLSLSAIRLIHLQTDLAMGQRWDVFVTERHTGGYGSVEQGTIIALQ